MSSYMPGASAYSPFPGIEVIDIGGRLTLEEFQAVNAGLTRPAHIDMDGSVAPARPNQYEGKIISGRRSADSPRDPWAPDHHWHADKTYWGENQFASALYAQRLIGQVAGTGFIDTGLLLTAIEADHPGTTEELSEAQAVFSVRRYYETILARKGSPEAITKTLQRFAVDSLEAVIERECNNYPEKTFPAIVPHPFRGTPSIMTDNVRLVRYAGLDPSRSAELMGRIERDYLDLPLEELQTRPYHYLHEWEEGQLVVYPQRGSLHRAMESPVTEVRRDTLRSFVF